MSEKLGKLYQSWVSIDSTKVEDEFQEKYSGNTEEIDAMAFYAGYMKAINTPKHETVSELRDELERTTETIRQFLNSPTSHATKGVLEECCKYNEKLIDNHHGKPEE